MVAAVILSIAVFIFAVLSVVAMVVVAGSAARWPGRLFSALLWLIVVASVGGILLSERVLRVEYQGLVVASEGDVSGGVLAKLLLAAVIGCSFTLCVAWPLGFGKRSQALNRYANRGMNSPNDIVIAFMIYYVAFSVVPMLFGEHFYFHVSLIYPFFVFLALFLSMQVSLIDPVIVAKQCLGILVFVSLIAAVVAPSLAVQPDYSGLIPGFKSRLWGVTASANSLGAVAGALLIFEVAEPSARTWLRGAIISGTAVALALTQSKTSISGALLGLCVVVTWRSVAYARKPEGVGLYRHNLIGMALVLGLCATATVFATWLMFFDTGAFLSTLQHKLDPRAVGNLSSAAGRTEIWAVAMRGGMENILFGQGADFWGLENRLRFGLTGGVHAHNQLLQAFSRAGLIGLAALLVFLFVLVQYSIRAARQTRGGSIAVLVVLLVRAMFEVPIQPNSILGAEFFPLIAYIVYIIDRGARPLSARTDSVLSGIPRMSESS